MTTPRIIRVFPRKTKATPTDALAYFGPPDRLAEADEIHVSVTFTYDKAWAEHLADKWKHVAPTKIGGVAYGDPGQEFIPGRYIKPGYIFTSRGCPRRCWFCSVWKRDPVPRPLPIVEGWNVLDDNLLACPRDHVEAVFAMLRQQKRRIEFTGGLEALSLQDYQVEARRLILWISGGIGAILLISDSGSSRAAFCAQPRVGAICQNSRGCERKWNFVP